MSTHIRNLEMPERIISAPEPRHQRAIEIPDRAALGPFGTLVQRLVQARQEQTGAVVVTFVSVSPGEGVSYVIESLSWELARHASQAVLVTSPAALAGSPGPFRITGPIDPRKVWRLGPNSRMQWQAEPGDPMATLRVVRERFGFVLVDCPALTQSSAIFSAASISDGIVLVVAAGRTTRSEMEETRRLLAATSVPTLGLVLNRHKCHVPKFLSKLF